MAQEYADIFNDRLIQLYGQELKTVDLLESNLDIKVKGGANIKIPNLTVSGYKDHSRAGAYNSGTFASSYETKVLDHDRDIEFAVDPEDVDQTNLVISVGNIHKRFESTQAIPEQDSYTLSKLYSEAVRVGATVKTNELTEANVLADFDENIAKMEEAGVPIERVILYCTPSFYKMLKNAEGLTRVIQNGESVVSRNISKLDDIKKIVKVAPGRMKTAYDFTEGVKPGVGAEQMNYVLVDPEAQISRVKYSYIKMFEPGSDSRTSDNYLYQNRKKNGTFVIDAMAKDGLIIHKTTI